MPIAKPGLQEQQHKVTELGLCIKHEGEGDSRMRELQVDGFVFTHVEVKIRSKREVEVGVRGKM